MAFRAVWGCNTWPSKSDKVRYLVCRQCENPASHLGNHERARILQSMALMSTVSAATA